MKTILRPQDIHESLSLKSFHELRHKFSRLEPADIAEALEGLTPQEALLAYRLVENSMKVAVFSFINLETQIQLLSKIPERLIALLLNEMEGDDRTALFEELSEEVSTHLISLLEPQEQKVARQLLSYPEDSVGRLMSPDFFAVSSSLTIYQAIENIRWNASRYPEKALNQIFVIDSEGRYLGDTSLAALFVAEDTTEKLEDVIGSSYLTLSPFDDREIAVDTFRKYDRPNMAVVDGSHAVVGLVSSDDVFDVAEEEATEDLQQFGGVQSLEDSYFQTGVFTMVKKRVTWLVILFLGGLWAGHALKGYEDEISRYAFLVFFLPLIISSGGNSGSQAASLIIRSLAIKEFDLSVWYKVFTREVITGIGLGTILGIMGIACTFIWNLRPIVAVVVFLSLIGVVTFGAVVGAMLPFLLKRIGLDPAVSSSPLIASLVDLFGILIFFNIALALI